MATTRLASHSTVTDAAMIVHIAVANGLATL